MLTVLKNKYDERTALIKHDSYRMVEGSAIGIVDGGQKLLFINDYHCGENLATFPSSYIMPKGSPLMVRIMIQKLSGENLKYDNICVRTF